MKMRASSLARSARELGQRLRTYPRAVVAATMLLSTLAVYLPFAGSLEKLLRYWDGPLYVFVAKTLYFVPEAHPFTLVDLPAKYFASHLPLYPLLIRALTPLTLGSYPAAMLLATMLSSVVSAVLFLELLREWKLVSAPLWTGILFCFLPPRWVIYHAVGATEPLFFCFVFAALLAYRRQRHGWVIGFVVLASLTRITGVLLGPAFALIYLWRRDFKHLALLPLAGLGLLALFGFYAVVFGDFFAYSSWNIERLGMLSPMPFEGFLRAARSGNYRVTELYVWLYLIYGVGLLALWEHKELFAYSLVFFVFGTFVVAKDLTRYYVALAPFALLVGFDAILSRPWCRPVLALVVYLDYVYAWRAIPRNMAPRRVWEALQEFLAR